MEYRYRLTGRAIDDARSIYEHIAEYSPERAEKWHRGLFDLLDTLRTFPLRCPRAPEGEKSGENVRHTVYGKRRSCYRILFVVRGQVVTILAICHASRGSAGL